MADQVVVKGFCDEAFLPVKEAFAANFAEGLELGASLAATHHGRLVVDLRAGFADRRRTKPWQEDTLVCVFSTTKIPIIICALMAIDRGLLDLDTPVAHYWPEFAAHGKQEITVREALSHRALVPGFATPQPWGTSRDWKKMVASIANEAPWFPRGTLCYHGPTLGHLLAELIQRATGRPFRKFFKEELTIPLGADFHIGIENDADFARLAKLRYDITAEPETEGIVARVRGSFEAAPPDVHLPLTDNRDHMAAVLPGSNGACNARSLARIATVMAMGGTVDGKRYLSRELVLEAGKEQCHGVDPGFGDLRMGLGFALDWAFYPAPTPTSFHWGGAGGSWCVMDTERETAFAYAMNRYYDGEELKDPRMARLWDAISQIAKRLD